MLTIGSQKSTSSLFHIDKNKVHWLEVIRMNFLAKDALIPREVLIPMIMSEINKLRANLTEIYYDDTSFFLISWSVSKINNKHEKVWFSFNWDPVGNPCSCTLD